MSDTLVINSTLPPPPNGSGDGWEIVIGDIRAWKNKDRDKFFKGLAEGVSTNVFEDVYPGLARIIKRWPYAGDPSQVESWGEIDAYQLEEAINRVTAAFQQSKPRA